MGSKKTRLALGKHSRGYLSASKRQHTHISPTFKIQKHPVRWNWVKGFFPFRQCLYLRNCVGGDGEKYFGEKRILEMENMEI